MILTDERDVEFGESYRINGRVSRSMLNLLAKRWHNNLVRRSVISLRFIFLWFKGIKLFSFYYS